MHQAKRPHVQRPRDVEIKGKMYLRNSKRISMTGSLRSRYGNEDINEDIKLPK